MANDKKVTHTVEEMENPGSDTILRAFEHSVAVAYRTGHPQMLELHMDGGKIVVMVGFVKDDG